MFGLGMSELVIIMVIALILFGAKRLPEIGSGLGKGIKNFKKSFQEQDDINSHHKLEENKHHTEKK